MKWLSKLLNWQYEKAVEDIVIKDTELNISEPVISFVQCVKDNPKRFEVEHWCGKWEGTYGDSGIIFRDKETNQEWKLREHQRSGHFYGPSYLSFTEYPLFLTKDEKYYLENNIIPLFKERAKRYRDVLNKRQERKNEKERQHLMGVYCK